LSAGLTAVVNGAAFEDRFTFADQTWVLEPKDDNLVLTYDPEHWSEVTFDPNNGEDTWTRSVLRAVTLTEPEGTWEKDGYVNEGKWYIDGGTTEFIFGTTSVSGNITLHLRWTAATVTISTTTVSNGLIDRPYSSSITASLEGGAAGAISFSVHTGALPPGLSLNTSTGVISGTPTVKGDHTFTVRATSVITGENDNRTFTISILSGYYHWENDPNTEFDSLADALASGGSGKLIVVGSVTDDLVAVSPIVFDKSVILCFEEGAELTLKNGNVTIGGVDLSGGKLILDNTTLIIIEDLTGSGDVELINNGKIIVEGNMDIDGSITGSGDISADGNVNIGGGLNMDGDVTVGGDLDVGGDTNIGGGLTVGGNANIDGNLEIGGDLTIGNSTISVKGIGMTYPFTGSEIMPSAIVTYSGETLAEGTDYVIVYSNNTDIGKAKMTITFIGEYEHIPTLTKSFYIAEEGAGNGSSHIWPFVILTGILLLIMGALFVRRRSNSRRNE